MADPSSFAKDFLLEELVNTCNIDHEVASDHVLNVESLEPQDASQYLLNVIHGDGKHVIEEYLRRRTIVQQSKSVHDFLGRPMKIYKKPELPSRTLVSSKNKKKVTQDAQARKNASVQSKHNQIGAGGSTRNPEKVHIEQRAPTGTNHIVIIINNGLSEPYNSQPRKHKLTTNCLHCCEIVCENEGEGPCSCQKEVCCDDGPAKNSRGPIEGNSEAVNRANMLNKFLEQACGKNLQKSIIDDQDDSYCSDGNAWITSEENKEMQRRCEEAESIRQNREVLQLDGAGGKVYVPTEKIAMQYNPISRKIPDSMKARIGRVQHNDPSVQPVFDICIPKNAAARQRDKLIEPVPALCVQNKVNKQISEDHCNVQILMPGMILLKNWLSKINQVEIVKTCRILGVDEGAFYQPSYGNGRKMHLWLMCLGTNWNPETKYYKEIHSYDNAQPPAIPADFNSMVENAIQVAHNELRRDSKFEGEDVQKVLPLVHPDVCIVNFYKESGRLGLHQDKDESRSSLQAGLPVVSFSIGDAAEFLYGNDRNTDNAHTITLESGDVLMFGGESRHIFHGISHVKPHTCPNWLTKETQLRPGRLNLTFRQI